MEIDAIGRVLVEVTIENLKDLWEAESGYQSDDDVRRLTVSNALVDTGATTLSLPTTLIQQLGLKQRLQRRVTTSTGGATVAMYDAVRLTIHGRECTVDVMEVLENVPVLVGQVPLELLDFVIDPRRQRLMGNPEHGGEHMLELY
ncbi:MAG: aspartyl protease [Planctomycetaceae bacterium]|nr:aspartyl protease [Planctomycetaceae bacterium]